MTSFTVNFLNIASLTSLCLLMLVAVAAWLTVHKRRKSRVELSSRIVRAVAELYWPIEPEVVGALRRIEAMRSATMFRDVTAFDVLVYKFRRHAATNAIKNGLATTMVELEDELDVARSVIAQSNSSYQFRHTIESPMNDVHADMVATPSTAEGEAFAILNKIDRLFDLLTIRLPLSDVLATNDEALRCPGSIVSGPFGRTICGLIRATAAIWPDERAECIRQLDLFFCGGLSRPCRYLHLPDWLRRRLGIDGAAAAATTAGTTFDAARAVCGTDAEVEHRVRSRLPYVDSLRLVGYRFVLADVRLTQPLGSPSAAGNSNYVEAATLSVAGRGSAAESLFDIRAKIRFIDELLSRANSNGIGQNLERLYWPELVEAYSLAVELSIKVGHFGGRGSLLPEFSPDSPPPSVVGSDVSPALATRSSNVNDLVILLRHVLRLMCAADGKNQNGNGSRDVSKPAAVTFRQLGGDPQFHLLLTRLHDALYVRSSADIQDAVHAVINRSRANVIVYAQALTADSCSSSVDPEITRAAMEKAESDLHRHLDYLMLRRRVDDR